MRWWTLGLFLLSAAALSANEKQAFLNEKDAGPDFAVQGEYTGEVTRDGEKYKLGVQIIALGDGKFQAVAFLGGLPGDGWNRAEKIKAEGKRDDDGTVKFGGDNVTATVKEGVITIRDANGNTVGELTRIARSSPTLGEKPPAGAIVLFDGTNVDAWEPGKMEEEGLMGVGTRTRKPFANFRLHLEFRTPFMPNARGQARGNSGMYLQDQYECQILDSFGLEGENNECGGIYQVARPRVNMCLPPLSWQTYDVDFTTAKLDDQGNLVEPARVTIRHNGVVIHENLPLKVTPGGGRNDHKPGPLYLQDHGDPVRFRNIWIVEKP